MHGGHGAAVQVEAGDLLQQRRGADVGGDLRVLLKHIGEVGGPLLRQEEGPRPVPCGQGTAQDAGGLGDVQALGGFPDFAQVHVRELRVVRNPRVVGGFKKVKGHGQVIPVRLLEGAI